MLDYCNNSRDRESVRTLENNMFCVFQEPERVCMCILQWDEVTLQSFFPFLHPFGILGMHGHVLGVFLSH